jgi:hypothetical protein
MSTYLYGIVRHSDAIRRKGGTKSLASRLRGVGVGSPPAPVELLRYDDLAALVSDVNDGDIGEAAGVRGMRRDMAAHADVLSRVAEGVTVLPVRFGVMVPDDDTLVEQILKPQYDRLGSHLKRLDGAVELTVRAAYVEGEVLQEVVREQPRLAQPLQVGRGRRSGTNYQSRIDLGRKIAAAVQAKRDRDQRWLVERLRLAARDVVVNAPGSDLVVLNGSFLVERRRLERFDRALEHAAAEAGQVMQLNCIGPLPPYSFAAIRLPAMGVA